MALTINTNVSALLAGKNLQSGRARLGQTLERLSTGLRINRSQDDPSGLVISEFQRSQISGLSKVIENVDRAISLTQTAEGGLAQIANLLVELRGLAVDSANNGALTAESLQANQANIDSILDTVDRIANTTRFGQKNLLDGTFGEGSNTAEFEDGHNDGHFLSVVNGVPARWADKDLSTSDVVDIWYDFRDQAGSPNNATPTQRNLIEQAFDAWEVTSGGLLNFVQNTTAPAADILNAGTGDLAAVGDVSAPGGTLGIGGFAAGGIGPLGFPEASDGFLWMDEAETWDEVLGNPGAPNIDYFSVAAHEIGHALGLGHTGDIPSRDLMDPGIAPGEEFFPAPFPLLEQIHIRGLYGDEVQTPKEPGELIFHIGAGANENISLQIDSAVSGNLGRELKGNQFLNLSEIDVTTVAGSLDAIAVVDQAINDIANKRGEIGSFQDNLLESTQSNVRSQLINIEDAESSLRDTDYTVEITALVSERIRNQVSTTMQSLANQHPRAVLSLLQG